MISPIKDLEPRVQALSALSGHLTDYDKHIVELQKMKEQHAVKTQQAKLFLEQAKKEFANISDQTKKLLSQKSAIMEKFPWRTAIVEGLPKTALRMLKSPRFLGTAIPLLGVGALLADPASAADIVAGPTTELDPAETKPNMATDYEWDKRGKLHRTGGFNAPR